MSLPRKIFDDLNIDLIRKIADGGMGTVYEARQNGAGSFIKSIAVKVIREEYSQIRDFRANFFGEAQLVADLIHTNIVQTYHLGEHEGKYFLTMEFVHGITLAEFIEIHVKANKKIPADLAVFVASRIARGLAYAHRKRDNEGQHLHLVHRDVNTRNVMIGYEGDVKLTDFGIAKARNLMYNKEGRVIAGRYEYISPEQARKEVTDSRADLFSIGIVLLEMLTGENRFLGFDDDQSIHNILNLELQDFSKTIPGVDHKLNQIIHRCLERNRQKRYQTAADLLTDLEMFIYGEQYGPTNEKLSAYMGELFQEADILKDNPQLNFCFYPYDRDINGTKSPIV